jgi:N4-gp56 family major capsid protein
MASSSTTLKSDLIIPEVLADMIAGEFQGNLAIARSDMVRVAENLMASGGDSVKIPRWSAISDADDLTEDQALVAEVLGTGADTADVVGAGKLVEISDQALLAAHGDPMREIARQYGILIARKIDAALVEEAETTTLSKTVEAAIDADAIIDAKAKFGDAQTDLAGLILHSEQYAALLKNDDFKSSAVYGDLNGALATGAVGSILGMPVFVSDRVTVTEGTPDSYTALLVKRGALGLFYARTPQVEVQRNIEKFTTKVSVSVFYAVCLFQSAPLGVVKLITQ